MTHEACESKLRSVVRSSMHLCPGNWVAILRAVVYYAWAAHAFSAGIKYRHCSSRLKNCCRGCHCLIILVLNLETASSRYQYLRPLGYQGNPFLVPIPKQSGHLVSTYPDWSYMKNCSEGCECLRPLGYRGMPLSFSQNNLVI